MVNNGVSPTLYRTVPVERKMPEALILHRVRCRVAVGVIIGVVAEEIYSLLSFQIHDAQELALIEAAAP